MPETTLGGEAARERAVGFDVDDRAALLPGLLEEGGQELAPLSSRAAGLAVLSGSPGWALVRRLYRHRDKGRALDRIVRA